MKLSKYNILHTISELGISGGGPSQSVYYTVKGLRDQDVNVDILTYKPDKNDRFISEENYIIALPNKKALFAYSSEYKQYLENHSYDIYHAQGVWLYPTYIAAKIARKQDKPYLITPRGMLYPQALAVSKLKKQLFLKLFLLNDLSKASAVHATCLEEMQYLRNLGVKSSIAVIPNPINILEEVTNSTPDKIRIGYLGRVHPRKNIKRLIYAWEKLGNETNDKELVIIGAGDEQYLQFLKDEVLRLNLKNILFTGFLSGESKDNALCSLSYLVVPSDFENFGMIVPEALIQGIPVIASKGTPWEELNTHNCGWWVDNDVEILAATIEKAIHLPENERIAMGKRGQELIKNNYSVEVVSKKMIRLYEWILNGGEKPEFVYE
ncbi:GDP-mannose-dependent alpha-(1-6)-phosphatidylinositol dimannoside mannosyltransferase [termite gut metagenome]|uniref:GDP-mannose-dependent alpha-(1-6)-phosphatidylinositol dimannoside mannosyltransferase n=1 Tax=termite gut metagenome TaxID=433724 RepID=A0A5J4T0Z1_9ZZZZ